MYQLGALYEKGHGVPANTQKAYRCYLDAYQAGSSAACWALGRCAQEGRGTRRNGRQALAYYREGAGRGDGMCMYALAQCYFTGRLVPQSLRQARLWCSRAQAAPLEIGQQRAVTHLQHLLDDAAMQK